MDAYELHEGRLVQERNYSSAVIALSVQSNAVPDGKVWTFLAAGYLPSIQETKIVQAFVSTRSTQYLPITNSVSVQLGTPFMFAFITEGMEYKLFPGDSLIVYRDSATALSTMGLVTRYIESDLPYYAYEEPLKRVLRATFKRGGMIRESRSAFGSSLAGITGGGADVGGGGGRDTGSIPI